MCFTLHPDACRAARYKGALDAAFARAHALRAGSQTTLRQPAAHS
jgi:hypothetical protein